MVIQCHDYAKHLKAGATGIISASIDPETAFDLHGIVVQINNIAAELEVVSGEFPVTLKGVELPAEFTVFSGDVVYSCPVVIGKNSSRDTIFVRFNKEAGLKLNREYFRRDVFIPFYLEETVEPLEKITDAWLAERLIPMRPHFEVASHGEGSKVLNWKGHEIILPHKINLSGGGLRFATAKQFSRGSLMYAHLFLESPSPLAICAVAEICRSELFYLTMENREFYNWAKVRLKTDTMYLTAGKFVVIDEKDRGAIGKYLLTCCE